MKRLRIAGLCLVSMLSMGMALAGNASAAPLWLVCLEGSGLTKYSSNQCTEASSTGKWQSLGLPTGASDTVRLLAYTLLFRDVSTGLDIHCPDSVIGSGLIEPPKRITIRAVTWLIPGCFVVKGFLTCTAETLEKIEAVGLPWTSEMFETEGKTFGTLTSSTKTGWSVTCGGATDTCEEEAGKPEVLELRNGVTKGVLLVLDRYVERGVLKCSIGGAKAGVLTGLNAILLSNGNGLSVNPL
jgi:hypothetical protein